MAADGVIETLSAAGTGVGGFACTPNGSGAASTRADHLVISIFGGCGDVLCVFVVDDAFV